MDELSETALHESRHAAVGLLLDVPVNHVLIRPDGTGACEKANADVDADDARDLIKYTLAGNMGQHAWPPAWPSEHGASQDERHIAQLTKALRLTRADWESLIADTDELLDSPQCKALTGAVSLLLRRHGHVDEPTLKRLQAAAKSRDEDMDEDVTNQRDELGCLSDDAVDAVIAAERRNRTQSSNGSVYHDLEGDDKSIDDEWRMIQSVAAAAYKSQAA